MNVKELAHYHNALPPPPLSLSFTGLRTQLKSSERHTLTINKPNSKEAETVNLIEKCSKGHFQASLLLL